MYNYILFETNVFDTQYKIINILHSAVQIVDIGIVST